MLLVPAVLGQRHRERTTGERYESGLPPASDLPARYSIEFYLVAMLFVVFDLESAFVFAWAVVGAAPGLARLRRDAGVRRAAAGRAGLPVAARRAGLGDAAGAAGGRRGGAQ